MNTTLYKCINIHIYNLLLKHIYINQFWPKKAKTDLKFNLTLPYFKHFLGGHAPRPPRTHSAKHCTALTLPTYDHSYLQMAKQIHFWLAISSEQYFFLILYSEKVLVITE